MSKKLILAGCFACLSQFITAQQSSLQDTIPLQEIVVTAAKVPLPQRTSAKPTKIISQEIIQQSSGKDLAQLLNEQAGIIINGAYSNPGRNKEVYLRGASSAYTLILLNGVPITDASSVGGAFDLRLLPLQQIERIEILKGSQSTLYGSEAIAGVINIITQSDSPEPISLYGSLSAGSLSTTNAAVGLRGTQGILGYNVAYNRFATDGISEALNPTDSLEFDKDGLQQNALLANFSVNVNESLTIAPTLQYTDFTGDYDGGAFADAPNTFDSELLNLGMKTSFQQNDLTLIGTYNFIRTDRFFNSTFGENIFQGRTHNAEVYGSYELNKNIQLLAGVFFQNAHVIDDQAMEKNPSYQITSPYLTFLAKGFKGWNLELGYRLNQHSEFGSHSTYSVAPAYDLNSNIRLFASFTTGFRSPNLDQLFGRFGANPDLQPETSQTYEIGTQLRFMENAFKLQLTYFDRSIDNVFVYDFSLGYQNQDQQDDAGLEADLNYKINEKYSLSANYSYVDGKLTTPTSLETDTSFFNLIRRPRHSFGTTLRANPINKLFVSLNGQYFGERTDAFFNPANGFAREDVPLDDYFLLNAYAEYKLWQNKLTVFTDLKNILDARFTEAYGFGTIGFNVQAGIRFDL